MIVLRNPSKLVLTDGTNFVSYTVYAPHATVRKCMQVRSCSICFLIFQMGPQSFHL